MTPRSDKLLGYWPVFADRVIDIWNKKLSEIWPFLGRKIFPIYAYSLYIGVKDMNV